MQAASLAWPLTSCLIELSSRPPVAPHLISILMLLHCAAVTTSQRERERERERESKYKVGGMEIEML